LGNNLGKFIQSARDVLSQYGRDYAIGAVRGLAVRNMLSVALPEPAEGFYPIVKIHEMALRELEDVFYNHVQSDERSDSREELIMKLVKQRVWE
jgi:hypothetical protein